MHNPVLCAGMWLYRTPLYQLWLHHLPWRKRCTCWTDGETCSDKMERAARSGADLAALKLIAGTTSTVVLIAMCAGILGCGGTLPHAACGHHVPPELHAFFVLTMADLGAPHNKYNIKSLNCWAAHENSSATWNPLDTTLQVIGSTDFNTINGQPGVQNYTSEAQGAQATADTIANGWYPTIESNLKAGYGVCGDGMSGEFQKWSGAYGSVC